MKTSTKRRRHDARRKNTNALKARRLEGRRRATAGPIRCLQCGRADFDRLDATGHCERCTD
jgi:hypothetical protein